MHLVISELVLIDITGMFLRNNDVGSFSSLFITTMREKLSRCERQNGMKDQEIKKQKQKILDLNVVMQSLFNDDSFSKN